MNIGYLLLVVMLPLTISGSAQDWQHCKPDGSYSFAEVKDAVRRVMTSHIVTTWDEKVFNRSGDLVSLAIVQTLADKEMISPQTLERVLSIIREAFACPARCVTASSDRQPANTLLLLEHLHNSSSQEMRSKIDEIKMVLLQKAGSID